MPTITLNRKVFEKLVGQRLKDEQLKDRISMLGTDLESITPDEIHVEIFPNRPDMLSEQGFARAFASFIGARKGLAQYKVQTPSTKSPYEVLIDSSVTPVRPYTACAVVKGLVLTDEAIREIIQIQEKLHVTFCRNRKKAAIGIYPLEKITFPITYFAADPTTISFRALEAPREMRAKDILAKHPTGKEYAHLLAGATKFPFFKDAQGAILSMPPIINAHDIGKVTTDTTEVFVECSGFDYSMLSICLNMVVTALADMGGKIYGVRLTSSNSRSKKLSKSSTKKTTALSKSTPSYPCISPNLTPWSMRFDSAYVNKRLGLQLSLQQQHELLGRMGFGRSGKDVLIPAYRADILHQVDLVEDIAIAYGYEHFTEEIPRVATIGEESTTAKLSRIIASLLTGLGFQEMYTYSLTSKQALIDLGESPLLLSNSISEEYDALRSTLISSLLSTLMRNRNHEYPQHIFDIGTVFHRDPSQETGVRETTRLGVALCGDLADFTRIKQVLDYLFTNLGITYTITESSHPTMIPGRVGALSFSFQDKRQRTDAQQTGVIGEIHPKTLKNYGLEYPVALFEIEL